MTANPKHLFERRRRRVRAKLRRVGQGRPRVSVFRSNKHIYVQIIDDTSGQTLAAASSLAKEVQSKVKSSGSIDAATVVGSLLAERALSAGLKEVIFDRGGYLFHGRVKALAEAAREGGLKF